jgi:adenylate cyclase
VKSKRTLSRIGLGGLVGALLVMAAGIVFATCWVGLRLEQLSYDIPYTFRSVFHTDGVAIVYIDDDSYENLHQSSLAPLDRRLHARLLNILKRDGAKAAVFDVLFSDAGDPAADAAFARAIKGFGKVILAADEVETSSRQGAVRGKQLIPPASVFMDAAAGIGSDVLKPDEDLVVRRHYHGDPDYPVSSLSWAAARLLGLPVTQADPDHQREYWLNYQGPPGTLPGVSYYRAVSPDFPKGYFTDKVVFIGSRMRTRLPNERKDAYSSPYPRWLLRGETFMPGVEIHATEFINLWRREWLSRPSPLNWIAAVVLTGAILGYGIAQFRPITAVGVSLLALGGLLALVIYLMWYRRLWFPWMIIAGVQIPLALLWSVSFNSVQLYVQKRLMEHSLAMYVSPRRVRQIAQRPEILRPGAEKQELSILFSDIADFTTLSEGMDSDELAGVMNSYFEAAVSLCIHKTEGTVVKFIGDAIFAIWNAPEKQANHRALACEGALLLRDQAGQFRGGQAGLRLRTRIGLHCGVANVGNFGSSTRIDYTAIGESINLASRLEGLNKHLGTALLASADVYLPVQDQFAARCVGRFRLKGFEKAVPVYELLARTSQAQLPCPWCEAFAAALAQFQAQDFAAAQIGFRRVLDLHPADGPARFYLQHLAELQARPPVGEWCGEIELKEK